MTRKRRGRGEGAIYRRSDGFWCASVSAGYNTEGRRRRRTIYGQTKIEVQQKLRQLDDDIASGRPIEPQRLTTSQFLTRWLNSTIKGSVAPSTYDRYNCVVNHQLIPHLGNLPVASLQPIHIEGLYAELLRRNCSPRTQQLAGVVLGSALKHAVRLRLLQSNPCRDVPRPRVPKREMKVWSKSEVHAFLEAATADRLGALYVLALATGLRQGELLALEWSDFDFQSGALIVQRSLEEIRGKLRVKEPKSGKGRRIDLPPFAVRALQTHRTAMLAEGHIAGPVFCDTSGGHLRKGNLWRRSFVPLLKSAKVPAIRFHDLRHTHATLLLLAGENVKVVSERLGHAGIQITLDTYAHVLPSMQKAAAARIERLLG